VSSNPPAKTALVTGGNRGIGLAICQGLLDAGFTVILAARTRSKGVAAAQLLKTAASPVQVVELDVADDSSIHSAAEQLSETIGQLDVLINNAGIYPDAGVTILSISRDLLARTLDINTLGPIRVAQAFAPLLQKSATAGTINVSSGYGALDSLSANVPSYCLSKLALNGATLMLAEALKPQGIAVYSMCPGWVKTDMGGPGAPRTPAEGADTAVWLATSGSLDQSGKFFRDRQVIPF
jgi:NAD(P)-dependent dehydrogenase (short-subunit alcohol dehydrogenase family)